MGFPDDLQSKRFRDPLARDGSAWTAEEDALLGTAADRVIAEQLARSSVAVSNRRKKLGIASFAVRKEAKCLSKKGTQSLS